MTTLPRKYSTIALLFILLICLPSMAAGIGSKKADSPITMDFQNVDLNQVIRFAAEMTGKNFVVPEGIKGKVTVITPRPLSKAEAYRIFEAILAVHHYTVVKSGNVYRIIAQKRIVVGNARLVNAMPTGLDDIVCRLLYLHNAGANSLLPLLKPLLHSWGSLSAYIPTNALIIIDNAATVRKLLTIIKNLDQPRTLRDWYMTVLKYADAVQVEKIINSVYADFNSRLPKGIPGVKVFTDLRTNSLLVLSPPAQLANVKELVMRLDKPRAPDKANVHLYYPRNRKAKDIAKVLTELINKEKGTPGQKSLSFLREITVVADEASNTLVISATPKDYEVILPIIQGLDLRRMQVDIEALVVEVSASKSAELGVEWRSPQALSNSSFTAIGGTDFGTINKATILNPDINPLSQAGNGLMIGMVKGTIKYGGAEFLNLGALIKAMRSDSDTNILATPNILVMDNEEAEIMVGKNVPFSTGTNTGTNTITTIQRQDVGLKLQVTPQILEDGRVALKVYQEYSSLAPSITIGAGQTEVVTNKRSIRTSVVLDNGHMVVLGGLISSEGSNTVDRVPCLGSITGLKELFQHTKRTDDKRNMMVFLQPIIINSYGDLLDISNKKFKKFKRDWQNRPRNGSAFLPEFKTGQLSGQLQYSGYSSTPEKSTAKPGKVVKP